MSKFWGFAGALVAIAVIALISTIAAQEIFFTDLETECRFDRGEEVSVSVTDNNELAFEGKFPIMSTQADVDYEYSRGDDRIVLDIYTRGDQEPETYRDTCRGLAVYETSTVPYEGRYMVIVRHNGEEVYRSVINFDNPA